jgi:fucokinase
LNLFNYLNSGNFDQLCHAVDVYWCQKKAIAPGCEPQMVKNLMDALSNLVHGQSLAGAGGLSLLITEIFV